MSHNQIYDPEKDLWTQGGEIPEERQQGGAGTVVYDGKIYMACGNTLGHTSGTNNWFDEYDPATNTWKVLPEAPMNQGRHGSQAVVYKKKVYIAAGSPVRGGAKTQSIEIFSF